MNWEVAWTVLAIVGFIAAGVIALGLILWTAFLLLAKRAVKLNARPRITPGAPRVPGGKIAWA